LSRIYGFGRDAHVVLFVLLDVSLHLAPTRTLVKELLSELFGFFALAEIQTNILLDFEWRFHVLW
jgi:hypothetical protein